MGTGTGPYGDCRSNQCYVAVWSRWLESATRRVGFRALKKTLEAPYTTKVNNRDRTSRGTTLSLTLRGQSARSKPPRAAGAGAYGRPILAFLPEQSVFRYNGRLYALLHLYPTAE